MVGSAVGSIFDIIEYTHPGLIDFGLFLKHSIFTFDHRRVESLYS